MPFHTTTLPNGLHIVGETVPSARSVALGFFVKAGARDETQAESGVSHYLEHMAFKGSEKRSAMDVNRDFDRIGADYNAYTSEENTVYYASILPEYLPEVLDILASLLRPSLRQEDFDMEKKVIINEIGRYEDMPSSSAHDHVQRLHFGEHHLGQSILGSVESITALTRDQMANYFDRRYVPSNILLAIAGNFDWEGFVELAKKQCGSWAAPAAPRENLRSAQGSCKFEVIHKPKVTQEYAFLVSDGPAASSVLRHAADLLSMVIGDDSGSRLYWELLDEGLAESAGSYYREYEDTGAFYSYFSCDTEKAPEVLGVIHRVLAEVQANGVTQEELEQARNKVLSRLVRGAERPMGRMSRLATSWIYYGEFRSIDDDLRDYEKVTLADIRAVLDTYPLNRLTTLALGPLESLSAA